MNRTRRDTLLGIVFFGTLAFLLWATINLTDVSLDRQLRVLFPQAGSVDIGTNVMVLGKKVGKVGEIDIDYEQVDFPVVMSLLLRETVPLREGHVIQVRDLGVLGGKQVYIDPGRGPLLPPNTELTGSVAGSAFDKLGDIADAKGAVGERLEEALREIRDVFRNINDEESSIGRLIRRRDLYDGLLAASDRANTILQAVVDGRGALGAIVMNQATADDAAQLLANLRRTSERLTSTDGPLGVLLNDAEAARDLQGIFDNVERLVADARAGRGILGRLLQDEQLAAQFGDVVGNLNTLLAKANDPDAGALGAITSDPVMAANLKTSIANLREVSDALARGEGLLGTLLNDADLAVRFRRIMTQVSRAIEDAREAAPIGNFVQVLLGTF